MMTNVLPKFQTSSPKYYALTLGLDAVFIKVTNSTSPVIISMPLPARS